MKKILLSLLLASALMSCTNNTDEKKQENNSDSTKVETNQTTDENVPQLAITNFDKEADKYIDQKVEVTGLVDHVCKHGGKKILLVDNDANIHVESENRFEDTLVGNTISLIGVVKEFKVDEAYCQKMEKEDLNEHSEGEANQEEMKARKLKTIQFYRDSMKNAGVDHLSFYSLEFVSFK